jgi:aryl-alcohol dehydrogenase-like predicted oxidoreductase
MQVAQAWLLHRSPNILLIAGTSKRSHLRQNLSVAKLQPAPEIIAQLDSIGFAANQVA